MRTIVLIACSKQKLSHSAPARELYASPLFRKSLGYAEAAGADAIYVLSAKHGLLPIERRIEPYDVTLHSMSSAERRAWARDVLAQLRAVVDVKHDRVVFLAGAVYRRDLEPHIANAEVPLRGLGIGEQLRRLARVVGET